MQADCEESYLDLSCNHRYGIVQYLSHRTKINRVVVSINCLQDYCQVGNIAGGYFLLKSKAQCTFDEYTYIHRRKHTYIGVGRFYADRNTRRYGVETGRTSEADTWKRYGKVERVNLKLVAGCGLWMLDRNS